MSSLPIIFHDIEAGAGDYLRAALSARGNPQPVQTTHPGDTVRSYVRVEVTGGGRTSLTMDAANLVFECYSDDSYAASQLAALVRALVQSMDRLEGRPVIYGDSEISRPQSMTDPETGVTFYTQTHQIRYRGYSLDA